MGLGDSTINDVETIDMPFAGILDTTSTPGVIYDCLAEVGSSDADAVWRISRFTIATGKTEWADGDSQFNNIAADRATLTYS